MIRIKRRCKLCGKLFDVGSHNQYFCSNEHRQKHHNEQRRIERKLGVKIQENKEPAAKVEILKALKNGTLTLAEIQTASKRTHTDYTLQGWLIRLRNSDYIERIELPKKKTGKRGMPARYAWKLKNANTKNAENDS